MKDYMIFSIFNSLKRKLKNILIVLVLIIAILRIQSLSNFKAIYLMDNYYYIIKPDKVSYYYDNNATNIFTINFENYDQRINTESEAEMINLGTFKDNTKGILLVVKHYLYAIKYDGTSCYSSVPEINGYQSEVYPIKCRDNTCFFIMGILNSNKELNLFFHRKPDNECPTELRSYDNHTINDVDSKNINCQPMQRDEDDFIICFYQKNSDYNNNKIIVSHFNYSSWVSIIIPDYEKQKEKANHNARIIKSILSQDKTKALVCYIDDSNDCYCLIYYIDNNNWANEEEKYLEDCRQDSSSLHIEYFENKNEYIVYCFQSDNIFNLQKFDLNFQPKTDEQNGIYDLSNNLEDCSEFYISSLVHDLNDIEMFVNCGGIIMKKGILIPTTLPLTTILTTLPETTILTTLPVTTILTTLPVTTILTTLPETTILTTLPLTTILTTLPETTILTTLPVTTILTTLPVTTILTTLPVTTILTTLPVTTILTTLPETTILTTLPETTILTTLPETTILTTLPVTTILTTLPVTTILTTLHNQMVVMEEKTNKTKGDIISNIEDALEDYDIGQTYEIFGDDFNIKVSPINSKIHGNISTYIDFSNCEKILREKNKLDESSILTVYQIEMDNPNNQSLINDVQYAVFNEKKEKLDLSVCSSEQIDIYYQIDSSKINTTKINYYSELGIDVFDLKGGFFNDICYSFSEGDSDMVLDDRVSDIYQNYSICEDNCEYNMLNLTENLVSCKCSVKTELVPEVNPPKLDAIIRDTFADSNVAVIKCYKLVFSFDNKLQNKGFLIFSVLVLLHIPFFIYYAIYNISSLSKFIFSEMNKFHYGCQNQEMNPPKKFEAKKIKNKKKITNVIKPNKDTVECIFEKNSLQEKSTSRLKMKKKLN